MAQNFAEYLLLCSATFCYVLLWLLRISLHTTLKPMLASSAFGRLEVSSAFAGGSEQG